MFIATLLLISQIPGQLDQPNDPHDRVAVLVDKLEAQDLAVRVKAERELIELGPAALEHLPEPSPRLSAEARQRLERVRQKLFERQVAESTEASRITLSGEGMPVADVFAAIEKQTGNKIVDLREQFGQEVSEIAVDVDFDQVPFWQALDSVLDQAKLTVYPYHEGQAVGVVSSTTPGSRAERSAYQGPFRIEATEILGSRNFREAASQSLTVTLEVSWEPRLKPIVLQQPLQEVAAQDSAGNQIPVTNPAAVIEAQLSSSSNATEMTIPLELPPRSVEKIASLSGKLHILIPGKTEKFEFADLLTAKGVEQSKAAATVTVDQVRKNGAIWEVYMRLRFDDAAGALESHQGWVFQNNAYLVDSKGEPVKIAGLETTKHTPEEIGIAYLFDLPDEPKGYKFVYETPATILKMPIAYELKDLELP